MKQVIRIAVFMFVFVASAMTAHAAQYYVDSTYTGSTSNGALATPWKTLSQVQGAALVAGDIVSFKRGTTYSGTLTINRSGAAGNPITFNAYGTGANPQFIGTGSTITQLVYMYGRSYITFDGIEITDPTISPTDRTIQSKIQRGFYIDNSSNVVIKNCSISLVGVAIYLTGPNNTVESCTISNLRMVKNTPTTYNPDGTIANNSNDDDYGANPLVISSSNNKITSNYFSSCWAQSYDYGVDGGAVDIYADRPLIENNVITYNTFVDCNGVIEIGGSGGNTVNNTVLAYNKAINNGSVAYVSNSGTYLTYVNNLQFYNNVFLETAPYRVVESAMFMFKSAPTTANSMVLKNNIIQLYGTIDVARSQWTTAGALVNKNNVYKLGSGSVLNFTQDPTEVITTANYWTNTSASDPATWDFRPIAGSVIVDRGTSVGYSTDFAGTPVPQGTAPDAGIYEYVANVTPDTTAPTVAFSSPAAGSTISGTVTVSADATDNVGVASVTFNLDGLLHTTDTTAPYSASWISTGVADGTHTWTAVARDAAGNTSTTATRSFTVANTVPLSVPTGLAADVSSTVTLTWTPSTGTVTGYKVYRNGTLLAQVTGTTYTDTGVTSGTTYTYTVSAYNSTTESAQSAAVSATPIATTATMYKTTAKVNVRANPTTWSSGTILGTQAKGAIGTVIGGPVSANGYTWYQLDFPFAPDGWVVSRYLTAYSPARTGTTTTRTSTTTSSSLTASSSTSSLQALELLQQASRATSSTEALRLIEQAKLLMQ